MDHQIVVVLLLGDMNVRPEHRVVDQVDDSQQHEQHKLGGSIIKSHNNHHSKQELEHILEDRHRDFPAAEASLDGVGQDADLVYAGHADVGYVYFVLVVGE